MSGIAGIIHFDGAPIEPGLIDKMTTAMAYRGPDGIHHWVKGSVALGQCMLRTTPESLEEYQPLTNEDESLVLVMDGRVDNWEELRRKLLGRGAVLRDRSDAELVLRAYEVWGRDCLPQIDGDFALVIWNTRRQEAFCARDRMGNKPFNYYWDGKTLAFASELHPLLMLPWVPEVANEGMLVEFLAAEWYSRDETLWQGILRLLAAHRMVVDASGPRAEQYWQPDLWATLPYTKDEDYIEHYREIFTDSVRRLSRSHRTVAYEVSGGLDSSAVFCVAEHLRRAERLPAPGVEGYTLVLTDDRYDNDLSYSRIVGKYLDVAIREIAPSIMPLSWYTDRARANQDFPGFPNGVMLMSMKQQASLRGCRVMLTGEGGDQWLQGSRAYYAEELAQRHWHTLHDCFKTDSAIFGFRQAIRWFIRHGFFPLLPAGVQDGLRRMVRRIRRSTTRGTYWLSSRMEKRIELRRGQFSPLHSWRVRDHGQRELLKTLYNAFTAQVMERIEGHGARFGIEMRHPLQDHRFVQYSFSTPERVRLRGNRTKYIHVQALQGLMPQDVLERKSKAEFSAVFREHLDMMKEALTETLPQERGDWVVSDRMARLFREYTDNPQAGWPLWILWSIHGCDMFLPKL